MAHIHRYKQNKPEKAIQQLVHFNNVSPMFPGLPKPVEATRFDYNRNFVLSNTMSVDDKMSFWDLIGSRDFLAKNPTTEEKIDKIVRIEVKSSKNEKLDDIKMYHTKMKVRYNQNVFVVGDFKSIHY